MNEYWKKEWIKALRSGRFRQTNHYLEFGGCYCCLGVLDRVIDPKTDYDRSNYSTASCEPLFVNKAELSWADCEDLAAMNDAGATFPEIADWIEANL